MDQSYFNEPSITAEEFASICAQQERGRERSYGCDRDYGREQSCGCDRDYSRDRSCSCDRDYGRERSCGCDLDRDRDCGPQCGTQMVCCCRAVPAPAPNPPAVREGCCCKQAFRAALRLLCDQEVATLLDFDQAAFITDRYVAGGTLAATVGAAAPADNVATITGSFRRFTPCSCDLLDINAELTTAPDADTALAVTQVNLCELTAIVLELAEAAAEGDLTPEEVAARNFRRVKCFLSQRLNPCGGCDDRCTCDCSCDDCCCAAGVLASLAQGNLSRRVSLAAGPLLLNGVTLLGTVGNVLVLANDTEQRLYFICTTHVQFLA